MQSTIETLKKQLDAGAAVAVCGADGAVRTFSGRGVKPLLSAVMENPALFENAVCADKAVGKAAALLFAYGKARAVYAALISESAVAVFERFGIPYTFGQKVPYIQNRDGTGMCPLEALCANISEPAEALETLKAKIAK